MSIKIALAGNPNCGKTTLFNNLTGSNQYVGNWPGVTVEKKEGKLKGEKDVIIQDLPGIYSLSPYTLEEVVARNYLVGERPDAILNIIVGTLGVLYGGGEQSVYAAMGAAFTGVSGMSFLIFNLLCAPCFAAMGAIKREMNNRKWFWFAIGYECGFAYVIALIVNQLGNLFTGTLMTAGAGAVCNIISLVFAVALLAGLVYMLFRPYKESTKLTTKVKV